MKGGGLSADSASNIYGETGEGNFTPGTNFGSSVFRLTQSGNSLQVTDWFTPWNQAYLSQNDLDLNDAVLLINPGRILTLPWRWERKARSKPKNEPRSSRGTKAPK